MKKVQPEEGKSADIVSENIKRLKELFPDAFSEGEVDFEVLRQLLGDARVLDEGEEKYGLNWHGKKKARQIALTPSTGTLLPCPEESVNWDTTKNLFIEGDNLEVLKLLQKSYANKVKMIYIDPPYNTGGDFIYPDNYQDNLDTYLKYTKQKDDKGLKLSSNQETSGRYHTNWLSMMYPRLKVARNLLAQDGLIFISIDDGELAQLRAICSEIFGQENFLACFIWKSRQNKDNRTVTQASVDHEYIVCYGNKIRGDARNLSQYKNPDNDPRGDWASANMVGIATIDRRPNLHYDLIDPRTNINYGCPAMGWRYDRNTMSKLIEEDRILWPANSDGRPRRKSFSNEMDSEFTGFSTIIGEGIFTRNGTADIDELIGERVFTFPKPVELISQLVEQGANDHDIVMDFFSGSGTTAHAVWSQNSKDGGKRRVILVQLPEPLDDSNRDQKTAAKYCERIRKPANIAELTKERLRQAGKQISQRSSSKSDIGFKVFNLASSNIHAWNPNRADLDESLLSHQDHLIEGRSEQDVLYELLLKRGVELTVPIESKSLAGKTIYSIGYGVLFACLDESITKDQVEEIGQGIVEWHRELAPSSDTHVFFRDSAFSDDVSKTNMAAILEQNGINHVRSL